MPILTLLAFANSPDSPKPKPLGYRMAQWLKTLADRIFALILLMLFSPIMLVTAIAIRIKLGSPVLFNQERPGKDGKIFLLYKFRTMLDEFDSQGKERKTEDRIPPFGQFLRSASLDELPQLLNVLKGDMSFVGPRPLLVRYLPRYSPTQARRHEVKPGITGWAQVNGRCELDSDWDKKLGLDVWYVDHWSLALDLKIFIKTIVKVLRREGVQQAGHATSEEFWGSTSH